MAFAAAMHSSKCNERSCKIGEMKQTTNHFACFLQRKNCFTFSSKQKRLLLIGTTLFRALFPHPISLQTADEVGEESGKRHKHKDPKYSSNDRERYDQQLVTIVYSPQQNNKKANQTPFNSNLASTPS